MKWLTVLFTCFVLLIIVLADTGRLGALSLIYHIPYADKAGHFILYGILTLLMDLMLFRSFPSRSRIGIVLIAGLTLAPLIGLEELSQRNLPTRTFDLMDLSASYLGLIFFSWVAMKTNT